MAADTSAGGWDLSGDASAIARDIRLRYVEQAMPFFSKFRGWTTVFAAWERDHDLPMISAPPAIALRIGVYLVRHGEHARGTQIVRDVYWSAVAEARVKPPPWHEYVAEVAREFGIDLGQEPGEPTP